MSPWPARGTRRDRPARLAAAALLALACALPLGPSHALAQSPEPPTEEPATSPPPTELPPTIAPPTARPTSAPPTARPADDDEEPPPPPPPPEQPEATAVLPAATPTRRPTRTPRTTPTPPATPVVAAALRLTLAQETSVVLGEPLVWSLSLANQELVPALDVTIEIAVPAAVALESAGSAEGQVLREGALVRWYLPRLEPGTAAELRLSGRLVQTPDRNSAICLILLSSASPLEHCQALRLASPAAVVDLLPPAALAPDALSAAVAEPGAAADLPLPLGWGLVIAGLVGLGAWLGLRRGSGRRTGTE